MNFSSPLLPEIKSGLLTIYSLNALINIFGISMSVGLVIITARNRRFHSTCSLLIGFCAICTLLLLTQHFIPLFVLLLPSSGTISFLLCFLLHIFPLYGIFSAISLVFVIGLDRLLSVFVPLWYLQRNERLGFGAMMAISAIFPFGILMLVLENVAQKPGEQTVCTLNELLGDNNTSLVAALCLLCNFLSIFCYAIVWAKLKWDLRAAGTNAETISSRQPIFKSLAIIMGTQVAGWCISELAFAYIFFRMDKDSPAQRLLAAAVNCFVCVAASTDPIVLFCTSEEYRKAFCEEFPWLTWIWRKFTRKPPIASAIKIMSPKDVRPRVAWNTSVSPLGSRNSQSRNAAEQH